MKSLKQGVQNFLDNDEEMVDAVIDSDNDEELMRDEEIVQCRDVIKLRDLKIKKKCDKRLQKI